MLGPLIEFAKSFGSIKKTIDHLQAEPRRAFAKRVGNQLIRMHFYLSRVSEVGDELVDRIEAFARWNDAPPTQAGAEWTAERELRMGMLDLAHYLSGVSEALDDLSPQIDFFDPEFRQSFGAICGGKFSYLLELKYALNEGRIPNEPDAYNEPSAFVITDPISFMGNAVRFDREERYRVLARRAASFLSSDDPRKSIDEIKRHTKILRSVLTEHFSIEDVLFELEQVRRKDSRRQL